MQEIFHRTSIRYFEDREVEQEKLEQILRAAMQAPTAGNQQCWEFYIVKNKELLEQLSKCSKYAAPAARAPLAIVVAAKDGGMFPEVTDVDCAIASEHIWLEADALGLGSVMLGVFPFPERVEYVNKVLKLPADQHAFSIFPIGYPVKIKPQQDRYDEGKIHVIE